MPRSTAGEGGTDKGFHCILIAPYPEMGAVFTPIARRMGCRLRVVVGQEDAAVAVARATPPDDCEYRPNTCLKMSSARPVPAAN